MRGGGLIDLQSSMASLLGPGEPLLLVAYGTRNRGVLGTLADVGLAVLDSFGVGPRDLDEGIAFALTPDRLVMADVRRMIPALGMTVRFVFARLDALPLAQLKGTKVAVRTLGRAITLLHGRFGDTEVDVMFRPLAGFPEAGPLGAQLAEQVQRACAL